MKAKKPVPHWATALLFVLASLASLSQAQTKDRYRVLHSFASGKDGSAPFAGLVLDRAGDLYGTTWGGGGTGAFGIVFELLPRSGGKWVEKVVHRFAPRTEGGGPFAGLVFDVAGNLYGTTRTGGSNGVGTVFEMTPEAGGWAYNVLDSYGSNASLIGDSGGNLYGNIGPGKYGEGAATELTHGAKGWEQRWLYSFCPKINPCLDGDAPYAGLTWDTAGNLYGTTELGGKGVGGDWGTVFELEHTSTGWKHLLLHSFPGFQGDGKVVYAGVIFDGSGNLYGATNSGGACDTCGTVFKLTRGAEGRWKESILYNFPKAYDGSSPGASLVFDADGNLYGTAATGGNNACANGCGVVFKLMRASDGKWTYSVVHRFNGNDGANPAAALILDKKGNLYGTTTLGGAGGYGVVFEITP
jgi:uncharacterized repeat protein (TIGR03803 family)